MRREKRRELSSLLALVALIIVVAIVVIILSPTKSAPMKTERRFAVSMTSGVDGKRRYTVDGEVSPTLRLRKGKRYTFVLDGSCEPLYLTSSPVGGADVPGSVAAGVDSRGLVAASSDLHVITEDRVSEAGVLYYQSTISRGAGGMVLVG
jgi:hypothetical protein